MCQSPFANQTSCHPTTDPPALHDPSQADIWAGVRRFNQRCGVPDWRATAARIQFTGPRADPGPRGTEPQTHEGTEGTEGHTDPGAIDWATADSFLLDQRTRAQAIEDYRRLVLALELDYSLPGPFVIDSVALAALQRCGVDAPPAEYWYRDPLPRLAIPRQLEHTDPDAAWWVQKGWHVDC